VGAAGAAHVVDRAVDDVVESVRTFTGGRGAAAVFDPIGAVTFEISLQLLAPRAPPAVSIAERASLPHRDTAERPPTARRKSRSAAQRKNGYANF